MGLGGRLHVCQLDVATDLWLFEDRRARPYSVHVGIFDLHLYSVYSHIRSFTFKSCALCSIVEVLLLCRILSTDEKADAECFDNCRPIFSSFGSFFAINTSSLVLVPSQHSCSQIINS